MLLHGPCLMTKYYFGIKNILVSYNNHMNKWIKLRIIELLEKLRKPIIIFTVNQGNHANLPYN